MALAFFLVVLCEMSESDAEELIKRKRPLVEFMDERSKTRFLNANRLRRKTWRTQGPAWGMIDGVSRCGLVALLQASGIWQFKSGPTFGSVVRSLYLFGHWRWSGELEHQRWTKKRTRQTSLGNPGSAGDGHIFGTIEGVLNIGGFGCWAMAWQIPKGFINRQDANNQIRSDKINILKVTLIIRSIIFWIKKLIFGMVTFMSIRWMPIVYI